MSKTLIETAKPELQSFDIVIAGGGLSGCLMALALLQQVSQQMSQQVSQQSSPQQNCSPINIAIVETNPLTELAGSQTIASFDERVLALSHGSVSYLKQLNAWGDIESQACAINNIHISDRGYYGKARVYAEQYQVDALGYVIEMSVLGRGLLSALKQHSNIHWFDSNSIAQADFQQQQVRLELADKQVLTTKLLLGCDGGQSPCRKFANIQSQSSDYQQSALIANVQMTKAHHNIAYERFTDTGPIAMLPLAKNKCSLVWTLTPEQAEAKLALSDTEFKQALADAFGYWLGNVEKVGKRLVYPLALVQAETNVYHRMALVGNASHTIHPIAGQGFNLGLRDVKCLAELVQHADNKALDIGNFALLNEYDQQRRLDHNQVIGLTDSLVTLFSNQHAPLVAGRNLALKALNYLTPVKQAFVNKTMGY